MKYIKEWIDYGFVQEDDSKMVIIGVPGYDNDKNNKESYLYILDKYIDENNAILYNNFKHMVKNIKNYYHVLSADELEKYVYSNDSKIAVYVFNDERFLKYYWKDLPKEIKDLL